MCSSLASTVRAERTAAGLSQFDLAVAANVKPGTIVRIENGHGDPSLSTLVGLARALGVSVGYLVGEEVRAAP